MGSPSAHSRQRLTLKTREKHLKPFLPGKAMSAEGFTRTLQTAADADGVTALLVRAGERAKKACAWQDARRLQDLAERYRDYAAALRETAADAPAEPAPDQAVLL